MLGLPGWVTGAVFTINTIMVGLGQGLVGARDDRPRSAGGSWCSANLFFAASFVVMLGATAVGIAAGRGRGAGRLGDLHAAASSTGGPVTAALAAEAAPDHLRGRYLSMIQLAWSVSGTVAPVAFAWLLDRGETPLWFALLGAHPRRRGVSALLGRVLPLASQRVTNAGVDAVDEALTAP